MNESIARFRQPFERAAPWLIAALLAWNFLRGFALYPDPYALGQYFYTYEGGFLIRGLMGSLVTALAGPAPMDMREAILLLSVIEYLLFIAMLWSVFTRLRADDDANRTLINLLFLVLLSGPLMVGIGATRGFHDSLILTIGLLAWLDFRAQRFLRSGLWMLLAILIHEQIVFFILPVMGWWTWLHRDGLRLDHRAAMTLILLSAATLLVVVLGQASPAQLAILEAKLNGALQTPYLEQWGHPFKTLWAARNDALSNIGLTYLERLRFPGHQIMLLPTLLFWAVAATVRWRDTARRRGRGADLAMLAVAMLMPHLLYLVAEDVHRYIPYTNLTAFLIALTTLRQHGPAKPLADWARALLIVAILGQTAMWDYDPAHYNARNSTPLLEFLRSTFDPGWVRPSAVNTPHA
ncbi:MAG: hypothetical protein H6980_03370 [Gammaproteobacteria bacterium]|nr:hypothetical protein [Gammaproteobacteria bacterium]